MAVLIDDELTLVSPRRLGAILREQREQDRRTLEQTARAGGGSFLVSDLEAFEKGRKPLDDATATALAHVYGLNQGPILPFRSQLVIDLESGIVGAGDQTVALAQAASPDQILARYLAMVQVLRAWTPNQPFPLRADDLAVLGTSLDLAPTTVEQRLRELLVLPEVNAGARRLRRRLFLPAAGLLVGTTAVGSLILVSQQSNPVTSSATAQTQPVQVAAAPAVITQIAEPVVNAPVAPPVEVQEATQTVAPLVVAAPAVVAPVIVDAVIEPLVETEVAVPEISIEPATDIVVTPEVAAVPVIVDVVVPPPAEVVVEVLDAVVVEAPVELAPPVVVDAPADVAPAVTVELGDPVTVEATVDSLQERGAASEGFIAYPWQTLLSDWTVEYLPSTPGLAGNTNVPSRTISVYIMDGQSAEQIAEILAHEVGHALDVTYLNDAARQQWLDARGASDTSWWPETGRNDFAVGSGDFAESVAAVFANSPSASSMAGPLTAAQMDLLRQLLP